MGKAFKWIGIILLILILTVVAAPFLFKNQIVQLVKDTVNKELNAKVNFGDFGLTLISSFPDFTLSVDNVSVANVGEFEGDTLLSAKNLTIGLDLMSVIKGEQYKINTISLDHPRIQALVLKNGKANWDITKPSADTTAAEPESESTPFKMTLQNFEIINGYILYDDASLDVKTELVNMNHSLSGDFTADNFVLETLTEIEKFTVVYAGVPYFNKVKTKIKADMDADMPNFKFTFKNNEFALNELTLGLDGYFAMPKDDMDMDLKFKANETEFKNILSLVPGVYTADFKDVKTKGSLALDGYAKGVYNDKQMPAFGIKLLVKDAYFQYPALPKSVNNIQVDLAVNNKTGEPDATVIDLNKLHLEMASNPVDMKLHVSTPVSDANIKGAVKAKINLATVKEFIPLEKGDELNGLIDADVAMAGRMSSIEKEQYEKFDAHGTLAVTDMNYSSKSLNFPTKIKKLMMTFTPQVVELNQFNANIGKSDIALDGKIENFLQYAMKDELLKGFFNLKSTLLDINELMGPEEPAQQPAKADTASAPMTVVEVPSNLDVTLNADIWKMLYDNLTINSIKGSVIIKDSKLTMDKLKMDLKDLGGSLALSGTYNTQNIKKPAVDFDLQVTDFDIAKTFKTFNSVQKLAPIAKYAQGKFGTTMSFKTLLDEHMQPDMKSLAGEGKLSTGNVVVEGFEPINKLADALKQSKYKRLAFENINASFKFKDGRVEVEEMPVKAGNINALVKGSTGFDQSIDYTWALEMPRAELGSQANAVAGSLMDQLNKKAGTNLSMSDKIKVKVLFGGTIMQPTVKLDLIGAQSKAEVKEQVKEKVKEVVTQTVDKAKAQARAEADKILKDAQVQADKIKAEAKVLAEKTRKEGYDAVDKTVNEAGNPIAKMAATKAAPAAKKKVDEKADKIIQEANQKADAIMSNARAESDKKLK